MLATLANRQPVNGFRGRLQRRANVSAMRRLATSMARAVATLAGGTTSSPLEGIVFVSDFTWDARDRRWEGGNFYSGMTGRTISVQAELVGEKMQVRAYMGTPLLG